MLLISIIIAAVFLHYVVLQHVITKQLTAHTDKIELLLIKASVTHEKIEEVRKEIKGNQL